jgi:hypothetical protein
MKIKIEIGTLVLEGFEYHDRLRISSALEKELTRQFIEKGLPNCLAEKKAILKINALPFQVPADGAPARVGAEAARAITKAVRGR